MVTILDPQSTPQTAPIHLSFHLVATLNVSADDARRQVNRLAVPELGTGLVAREPELLISGEQITWHVPIVLSLPTLGQVGTVDVDARTGELLLDAPTEERIVQHARRLYRGATL